VSDKITGWSKSDDGHLAVVFENGSLAVIHDSPPTDEVVIAAANTYLPGREPFYIRRSDRLPNVVYVHPTDAEFG
jgi:hypothetical protein